MTTDNSGGAFSQFEKIDAWEGLTKREYYAAHALQGMLAYGPLPQGFAKACFIQADAMVEASKK